MSPGPRWWDPRTTAIEAAAELGGPVVLKVISESALHKSDVGGVVLGVEGDEEVRRAYQQVTAAVDDVDGVLVQEFVAGGHEVLIGMTQDPNSVLWSCSAWAGSTWSSLKTWRFASIRSPMSTLPR